MKWLASFLWMLISTTATAQTINLGQRIASVEQGLLPTYSIKGSPATKMNIYSRMRFYRVPAVSIAVIDNGKIDWAKAYGKMDVKQDVAASVDTLFQAASISKFVTAAGALSLVQLGKLSLDGNVNDQLVSWKIPENGFNKESPVTLKELLSHTAGITVPSFPGYINTDTIPLLTTILKGIPPANTPPITVDMVPGTIWRYSGGGYEIVQQLMEDVSGEPFALLMREIVFNKAGMQHSTFDLPLPPPYLKYAASGYVSDGNVVQGNWYIYPELAAAGLWTTPSDLARFAIAIQQAFTGKSTQLLSQFMAKQMLTPVKGGMGLGPAIQGEGDDLRFLQSGGNLGFRCNLVAYASKGQGTAIMTNSDNGLDLIWEILRSISSAYKWPDYKPKEKEVVKVDPKKYADLQGIYYNEKNENQFDLEAIQIVLYDHKLVALPSDGGLPIVLYPESDTEYFSLENELKYTFLENEEGKVDELDISSDEPPPAIFKKQK